MVNPRKNMVQCWENHRKPLKAMVPQKKLLPFHCIEKITIVEVYPRGSMGVRKELVHYI